MAISELIDPKYIKDKLDRSISELMGANFRNLTDLYNKLDIIDDIIGTPDSSPPSKISIIGGYDGTYVRRIKTTTDGKLVLYLG